MELSLGSLPLAVPFDQTNPVLGVPANILLFGKELTKICVDKGGAERAAVAVIAEHRSIRWVSSWPDDAGLASYPLWAMEEVIQTKENRIFQIEGGSGGIFPLIHNDVLFGLLTLTSSRAGYFQPGLATWVQAFVDTAIHGLFRENDRVERMEIIHSINRLLDSTANLRVALPEVLERLTGIANTDAATVLRFNSASKRLDLLAARGLEARTQTKIYLYRDDGLAGKAAESRMLLWIEDLENMAPATWHTAQLFHDGFRSYLAFPLVCNNNLQGVMELFWRKPAKTGPALTEEIHRIAEAMAYSIERTSILDDLKRRNEELNSTYNATIEGLSRALELRDLETEGHTRRVSELMMRLAAKMDIPLEQRKVLEQGALLHDIGKLGIPDAILLKPGSLTPQEWKVMQQHPLYAYSILAPIVSLRESLEIPLYHHERWDGSGYPYGLVGDQIPLSAQLFAVVDVYDALTSDRPYRAAWSRSQAIQYLREQAGIQFSPVVVQHFLELLEDMK
jgi:HD-GYP domain-containing protein (c-di-GMP phosphodiesterase class II)